MLPETSSSAAYSDDGAGDDVLSTSIGRFEPRFQFRIADAEFAGGCPGRQPAEHAVLPEADHVHACGADAGEGADHRGAEDQIMDLLHAHQVDRPCDGLNLARKAIQDAVDGPQHAGGDARITGYGIGEILHGAVRIVEKGADAVIDGGEAGELFDAGDEFLGCAHGGGRWRVTCGFTAGQ